MSCMQHVGNLSTLVETALKTQEKDLVVNLQVLVSNTIWKETIQVAGKGVRKRKQTGKAAEKVRCIRRDHTTLQYQVKKMYYMNLKRVNHPVINMNNPLD